MESKSYLNNYLWIKTNLTYKGNCLIPKRVVKHYGENKLTKIIKDMFGIDTTLSKYVSIEEEGVETVDYILTVVDKENK